MKVILYMAITINGFIAKEDDDTSWISKEEWDSYSLMVRTARCLIVGRRTYHILTKQSEFEELKKVKLVAVSQRDFPTLSPDHLVAHSPREALKLLKDYKEVILAGGGMLNGSFIAKGLVNEIYLDIEPVVFGRGIKLFNDKEFEIKLKLLGIKKLSESVLQLHYGVLK